MVSTSYLLLLLNVFAIGGVFGYSTGDLRLVSSYTAGGRLEIYYNSRFTPFDIAGFGMHAADLTCKKLGYSYASRYAKVGTLGYSQASTTSYYISRVTCSASTTIFSSCSYSATYSSYHYNDVGLQCTNSRSSLRLVSPNGYNYGTSYGRLQIFINNTWGTVCDDDFSSLEARIACRQLGFSGYSSYDSADDYSGYSSSSSVPIWLDNLNNCNSGSTDLRKCTKAVGVHNCRHGEDIILTCSGGGGVTYPYYYTTAPPSRSGDLRLISYGTTYSSKSSGRLEMYYYKNGYAWRPFCSSSFNSNEADLACKGLGFLSASTHGRVGTLGYDQSSGSSYSIIANCYSYSTSFSSCSLAATTSCSHYYDVALRCVNYQYVADYPSTYSSGTSVGLVIGLIIGSLVLCSALCVGGMLCIVVIVVIHRKRKISSTRTTNVVQNPTELGNYRMSDLAARENEAALAAGVFPPVSPVQYAPSQFTPTVLQQEGMYPRSGDGTEPKVDNTAVGFETKDNFEDLYASDDEKHLIV